MSGLAKTAQGTGIETVQKSGLSPGRGYNAARRRESRLKPRAIGLGLALKEQNLISRDEIVLA